MLEKKLGLKFSANDVYINVIGGMDLDEPAIDLALALSLISSLTDKPIPNSLLAIGEIGLSGECRAITNIEQRVKEAARLGFTEALIPARCAEKLQAPASIKITPVKNVYDLLRVIK